MTAMSAVRISNVRQKLNARKWALLQIFQILLCRRIKTIQCYIRKLFSENCMEWQFSDKIADRISVDG